MKKNPVDLKRQREIQERPELNEKCLDCGAPLIIEGDMDKVSCPNGCYVWNLD